MQVLYYKRCLLSNPTTKSMTSSSDFWLWGFPKETVYRTRLASVPDLKNRIPRHVLNIFPDLLCSAVKNICAIHARDA